MARATAAQTRMNVALGESLQPAKQAFYEAITPLITKLTEWIEMNPKVTASLTLVIGAITGLITAVVGL